MPNGTVRSERWFARVTLPHAAFKAMMKPWVDTTRLLVVGHVGSKTEKEHAHILVEFTSALQKQTIDARFKKQYGVSGADYSSKVWDGGMDAGAGSYLFHDANAEIIHNKGFSIGEIEHFRKCNEQVQQVVEENRKRASGRCVDRVLEVIRESGEQWTRKMIMLRLLRDIRDGVMYEPGDFMLKRYLEEIYEKQLGDAEWLTYADTRANCLIRDKYADYEILEFTRPIP